MPIFEVAYTDTTYWRVRVKARSADDATTKIEEGTYADLDVVSEDSLIEVRGARRVDTKEAQLPIRG